MYRCTETDQVGEVVGEGGDVLGHDEQVPVRPEQRHGGRHQGVVVLRRVRGAPPTQGQLERLLRILITSMSKLENTIGTRLVPGYILVLIAPVVALPPTPSDALAKVHQ